SLVLFLSVVLRPPSAILFPYTTLFRSNMAIFLLRGLVREKAHWGTFPSELDNSLKDVKIITPEIQGVGEYYQSVTPDNFEDMVQDRKSTRLNSSHVKISYAVFCLKKKT